VALFRQQVQAFIDKNLSPAARSRVLADTARAGLADLIGSGRASPAYQTWVDGVRDDNEDDVKGTGGGSILYRFDVQAQAAVFALAFLQTRSPVRSGAYKSAFYVGADGVFVRGDAFDPSAIPAGAEIIIINTQPYARKIESGHMRMSVPSGVMSDARQAVKQRFPATTSEVAFMYATGDIGGGYVLRGRFRRGHRAGARVSLRSDTTKGQPMIYPALVINTK
jgi:hypothetical protein